jgi:genome maintenance exonuclease 1
MYNPKFQYTKLSREEVNGRRLYATPDGNNVPSVTTILDRTKSEEKKQILENWRRRVGHAQAQVSPQKRPIGAQECIPT